MRGPAWEQQSLTMRMLCRPVEALLVLGEAEDDDPLSSKRD